MNATVKQEVLVVTDGQSNEPALTQTSAAALRQTGVVVYSLGIGKQEGVSITLGGNSDPDFFIYNAYYSDIKLLVVGILK